MYQLQGQDFGPVSSAELKRLAELGTLARTDLVRQTALEAWSAASQIVDLFPDVIEPEVAARANSSQPTEANVGPPPLPPSAAVSSPRLPLPLPEVQPSPSKFEAPSPSTNNLKLAISDVVWKRLVQLQLPVSDDLFWIRLSAFRSRRKEPLPDEGETKGFWKRASEKIASLAESAEIQTNRYLIASTDGRYWVTNQLAAVGEAWAIQSHECRLSCHWQECELTVDLMPNSPTAEVEFAQFKINLSRPSAMRGHGTPNRVIAAANAGLVDVSLDSWACFPLVCRVQPAALGSFFKTWDSASQIGIAAVTESAIVFGEGSRTLALPFRRIIAWRTGDGHLKCVADTGQKLQYVGIAVNSAVPLSDDAVTFIDKIAEAVKAASEDQGDSADDPTTKDSTAPPQASTPRDDSPPIPRVDDQGLPARSLSTIVQSLKRECGDAYCKTQMLVAEFAATPLFGTPRRRLLVVCRDDQVQILVSESNTSQWQQLVTPRLRRLVDRWFVEAAGGEVFELRVDNDNEPIIAAVVRSLQTTNPEPDCDRPLVLLTPSQDAATGSGSAVPFRLHFGGQGILRFQASVESPLIDSFECPAAAVGKKSRVWNDQFGVTSVATPNRGEPLQLIASPATLIRIWETRELTNLRMKTEGISLGEMYSLYNEMRTSKFVTGVFGNYFLTQQRLELRSPLDSFINEIESAPSGMLPEELETALIERLSILEISRNQLNRWLDRCTLMFPHQQADLTRRWLEDAFGTEIVAREDAEKQAWRVHQQMRSELRQVQASMNRAMAEVGHNLNAIAFAFPEEVRCAALAATRRAASMAGKGAMVAAFAGMGGQMLMGLGRASVGDPLGIALLGTVGLSMVGRHLEKNAQDKEKKIRIRAYGIQALQWWNVVLETASVMALESRHTIEQMQKAAMLRDRKILESMPREKLPPAQKRMAAAMQAMLHEEVGNQFYEAIPGSGVFGWHIVDHMFDMTTTQPKIVLKSFSGEVPGSLAIGVNDVRRNLL